MPSFQISGSWFENLAHLQKRLFPAHESENKDGGFRTSLSGRRSQREIETVHVSSMQRVMQRESSICRRTSSKRPGNRLSARPSDVPEEVSEESWNAHVAASHVVDDMVRRTRGVCHIDGGSVYSAALALPQFARTSGWSLEYTAIAVRGIIFLLANVCVQGFLLYMLCKEERIYDKFGGVMHLCNLGVGVPDCPHAPDCVGPGGTYYTPERLFNWELWFNRNFVRDSFAAMFPERRLELKEKVDPGEYGLESYWLRVVCCMLFYFAVWPDLVDTKNLIRLLYHVPTCAEPWIFYEPPDACPSHNTHNAFEFVKFRVAGMPFVWKITNLVFVILPKVYLWILITHIGTLFLMETAGIEDMIMNSISLNLILNIDELICSSMFAGTAVRMLENVEPFPLFVFDTHEVERQVWERHQKHRNFSACSCRLFRLVFHARFFFMVCFTFALQVNYFALNCRASGDGSWLPVDLKLPVSDTLSFFNFVFSPVFSPIDTFEDAVWRMPAASEAAEIDA